jgi:hypothetical protein
MSASFEYDNYSIISSLNEKSIYIKVIDKITFISYENNIDSSELFLSIDLEDAYNLMTKCFQKEDKHTVSMRINSDIMRLEFHAVVGGYLKINFDILLREVVMTNDAELTINFQKMEQKYLTAIEKLTEKIEKLELLVNAISNAALPMIAGSNSIYYPSINSKELVLVDGMNLFTLKLFYQLEKITFENNYIYSFNNINNDTVTEIIMKNNNKFNFNGVTGPCIYNSGIYIDIGIGLSNGCLNNFPNLTKITFINCETISQIAKGLASYTHKIKFIKIQNCKNINNAEIMNYCHTNNITLDLS